MVNVLGQFLQPELARAPALWLQALQASQAASDRYADRSSGCISS